MYKTKIYLFIYIVIYLFIYFVIYLYLLKTLFFLLGFSFIHKLSNRFSLNISIYIHFSTCLFMWINITQFIHGLYTYNDMINVYHEKYGKCLKLWIDITSWRTNLTSFLNPDVRHTTVKFCVWIYIFPRKRLRIICIAYSNFILYKPQRMLTKSENVKCRKNGFICKHRRRCSATKCSKMTK